MLKSFLLASAVMISVPAFAQDAPAQDQATPPATQTAPTAEPAPAEDTSTPVDDAAPAQTAPAEPATPTDSAAPADQPAPAQSPAQPDAAAPDQTAQAAPAKQPATAQQVAQIVDKEFATYDKDGDGSLKTDEFGAWMVALRSATEPAFTGQSAADKEWIGKALAAADTDKSGGVSHVELKGFLAPQAAS